MEPSKAKPTRLEPSNGLFDYEEGPPFGLNYLKTYYNQPPVTDELIVARFLVSQFRSRPPKGRFLELGCGPTVHHVLPFAPHVAEIHMADYLKENLEQVELWRARGPGAHDWSLYTAMCLELEGVEPTTGAVVERERAAQGKVTRLLRCDLKADTPPELCGQYDAIGCFYCAEAIGITREQWRAVLARVAEHLRPGGTLYMSALAGMDTYDVRLASGSVVQYPAARLSEEDVARALLDLGFPAETMRIESTRIEQPDNGVTAVINVAAVLRGA